MGSNNENLSRQDSTGDRISANIPGTILRFPAYPCGMEAMGMNKFCRTTGGSASRSGNRNSSNTRSRVIGIVLIAIGALVLLLFVPYWVWSSVLAILLISIGFLIWRFG